MYPCRTNQLPPWSPGPNPSEFPPRWKRKWQIQQRLGLQKPLATWRYRELWGDAGMSPDSAALRVTLAQPSLLSWKIVTVIIFILVTHLRIQVAASLNHEIKGDFCFLHEFYLFPAIIMHCFNSRETYALFKCFLNLKML